MPGRSKSSVYFACPVMSRGSSRRLMAEPRIRDAMAASSSGLHLRGRFANGGHDVLVTGAAAEGAFNAVAHVLFARIWIALEQIAGGHDHPRRAVAALQAVFVPEGLLHDVQLAVRGQAFDGRHLRAVGLDGEDGARLDGLAVDEDRAGAALAGVAADIGAGEAGGGAEGE